MTVLDSEPLLEIQTNDANVWRGGGFEPKVQHPYRAFQEAELVSSN